MHFRCGYIINDWYTEVLAKYPLSPRETTAGMQEVE
jgi:hypothetical protein